MLLGDPGSGKTTAVYEASRALDAAHVKTCVRSLGAIDGPGELSAALGEALAVARGGVVYHLFLDGLDEVVTSVKRLSERLVDGLRDLDALKHLRLRVVCRGAALPEKLPELLANVYGRDRVEVYTLLPLRRGDVERVVREAKRADADAFLARLTVPPLAPLASRPLTLGMLLDHAGALRGATTAYEVIDSAVASLVAEPNPERPGGSGETLDRRRELACTLAMVSLLAGRPRVHIHNGVNAPPHDAITARDLDGFATRDEVAALVQSAPLFEDTRFIHRAIVEHLAAELMARAPTDEALARLFPRESTSSRVVPQLRGLATQLAARRRFFEPLFSRDPITLLDVDTAYLDHAQRRRLLNAVLARGEELNVVGWWYDVGAHLAGLSHPEIAAQLHGWITDDTATKYAREVAISTASHLAPDSRGGIATRLKDFALDANNLLSLRVQAARGVRKLDEADAIRALQPLLADDGVAPRDEDEAVSRDNLVGVALDALWPRFVDAATMFAALKPPRRDHYFGAHRIFSTIDLPKRLAEDRSIAASEVAPSALRWCAESFGRRVFWPPDELIAASIGLAVRCIDEANVADALAEYLLASARKDRDPDVPIAKALAAMPDAQRERRRWELLDLIVPRCDRSEDGNALYFSMAKLVRADDAVAMLDRAKRSATPEAESRWVELAEQTQRARDAWDLSVTERVLPYNARLDEAQRKASIDELCANAIGGDLDAFWQLVYGINTRIRSDGHPEPWRQLPIVDSDDWKARSDFEQRSLLAVAGEYLVRQAIDATSWLRGQNVPWSAVAGRHVFVMLASIDETRLSALDASVWRKWLPALLVPRMPVEAPPDTSESLLRRAYAAAPTEYRALVSTMLASEPGGNPRAMDVAVPVLDAPFVNAVCAFAHRDDLSRSTFQQVLRGIAMRDESAAERVALGVLARDWNATTNDSERAVAAAGWLLAQRPEASWRELRAHFEARSALGLEAVQATDHLPGHDRIPAFERASSLAEFYVWCQRALVSVPRDTYPPAPRLAPHDSLQWMLPSVLDRLTDLGTREALDALEQLRRELPDDERVRRSLPIARERYLESAWRGWPVRELVTSFCVSRRGGTV